MKDTITMTFVTLVISVFNIAFAAVTFLSCDEEPEITPFYYVHDNLQGVLDDFEQEAKDRGIEIQLPLHFEMTFKELDSQGLTQRRKSTKEWVRIYIDDIYKEFPSNHPILQLVVFHEMGHALYQFPHVTDYSRIMHKDLHTDHQLFWLSHRERMLDKFFDNVK